MSTHIREYASLMSRICSLTDDEKVKEVNQFFGTLLFVADIDHFDQVDYWQTPKQLLECGAGDCEDFALGKYFTLLEAGVHKDKIRLGYVQARGYGSHNAAHMVMLYFNNVVDPLVLDNLIEEIKPLSQRKDLTLVYSFNHDGVWTKDPIHKVRDNNLPLWTELLSRMKG